MFPSLHLELSHAIAAERQPRRFRPSLRDAEPAPTAARPLAPVVDLSVARRRRVVRRRAVA